MSVTLFFKEQEMRERHASILKFLKYSSEECQKMSKEDPDILIEEGEKGLEVYLLMERSSIGTGTYVSGNYCYRFHLWGMAYGPLYGPLSHLGDG